ncbi:hypothetical protein [Pedobacter endophyticus]|uniref:Uncharacterized protein n=1 Tax=Pedobacter endophyticus TaxID=2789740 RepID=A0A7S9L2V0_9SPHI|nr:hypothetical protein [Pedobacter endophyticus]QPH41239.1 hypothetical protein IZT61_08285 [Pedobacter endophyticus]
MKKANLLNRAEMKNIIGGVAEKPKSYKCCPNGYSVGSDGKEIVCSDCVTGTNPTCSQGSVVLC